MKVVTFRPSIYSRETIEILRENGFEAVNVPMIELIAKNVDVRDAEYTIVTSQTSARIALEKDLLKGKIIAIGPKTAKILEKQGFKALIPSRYTSKSLYSEFKDVLFGKTVNLLRSDRGDPILYRLSDSCDLKEYILYSIKILEGDKQKEIIRRILNREFDALVFTSSMIVDGFVSNLKEVVPLSKINEILENILLIAIGPPTAKKLENYGMNAIIPDEYTMEGVIKLLNGLQRA